MRQRAGWRWCTFPTRAARRPFRRCWPARCNDGRERQYRAAAHPLRQGTALGVAHRSARRPCPTRRPSSRTPSCSRATAGWPSWARPAFPPMRRRSSTRRSPPPYASPRRRNAWPNRPGLCRSKRWVLRRAAARRAQVGQGGQGLLALFPIRARSAKAGSTLIGPRSNEFVRLAICSRWYFAQRSSGTPPHGSSSPCRSAQPVVSWGSAPSSAWANSSLGGPILTLAIYKQADIERLARWGR